MNVIFNNWELISGLILGILGYVGGRKLKDAEIKKADEEIKANALDNISYNFKVYQELINDLESRFKARIQELEEDLERMKLVNSDMRKAISDQENYIKQLMLKINQNENMANGKNK